MLFKHVKVSPVMEKTEGKREIEGEWMVGSTHISVFILSWCNFGSIYTF